jgi:Flp pilus assembly protein TadG
MSRLCRRAIADDESGNAIIEFVFVAVLILVPTVYFVTAVASVGRDRTAVTQAAREAGRAFATADSTADGLARVQAAVRLAFADEGLPDDARVRFVAAADHCDGAARPGARAGGRVRRVRNPAR